MTERIVEGAVELYASDAEHMYARLSTLRQALRRRGGAIVAIRWSGLDRGRSALVRYEVPCAPSGT
jgi:hypothetical protein